ncbi:MAG: HEAT repeat domain-containing protein [Myxococcota bacterium]
MVAAITDVDPEQALNVILIALGDVDWRVRKEAIRVATESSKRGGLVARLVESVVQGENVALRNAAIEVLGNLGAQSTAALLETLEKNRSTSRKFIINAIGFTADPAAVPQLREVASTEDANEVAAAIDALALIGGHEAEDALRRCLDKDSAYLRMAALSGLAKLGARVPWQEVSPLLKDPITKRVALEILGRTEHQEAVPELVQALGDPSVHSCGAAAVALAQLYAKSSLSPCIRQSLGSLHPSARLRLQNIVNSATEPFRAHAAARVLLISRDKDVLPALLSLAARDALPSETLSELRAWGPDLLNPLLNATHKSSGNAQGVGLELAAELAMEWKEEHIPIPTDSIGELLSALRAGVASTTYPVTLGALRGLAWWADSSDANRISELADSSDPEIQRACATLLRSLASSEPQSVEYALDRFHSSGRSFPSVVAELGGERAYDILSAALASANPNTRREAVHGLAVLADDRSAEAIALALTDEDIEVQVSASVALSRFPNGEGRAVATDALLATLPSEHPAVQAAAARALGTLGDVRAIKPLKSLVGSTSPGVALAALDGLRRMEAQGLTEVLEEALRHADNEVVKQALHITFQLQPPRTLETFLGALEHRAWDVRMHAARFLGRVSDVAATEALRRRRSEETDELVRSAIEDALRSRGGL